MTKPDGSPLAGVTVAAKPIGNSAPAVPDLAVVTGADGAYVWPLAPGRYQLSVLAEGYTLEPKEVEVTPGRAVTLDFEATP